MDAHNLLATVYDTTITLRSSITYEVVGTLSGAKNRADRVTFSRDNTRIATCNHTYHYIKVWDIDKAYEIAGWEARCVLCILFSPSGEEIVSSHFNDNSEPSVFTVWSIESRLAIRSVADVSFLPLVFVPCCEWKVATINRTRMTSLIVFDFISEERHEREFDCRITDVTARSGHEQEIAVGIQNGDIVIWNFMERQETKRFAVISDGIRHSCFCFSCDGSRLFSTNAADEIDCWDVGSGLKIRTIDHVRSENVRWLGASPRGGSISIATIDYRLTVVDIENGYVVREFTNCAGPCYSNPHQVILM
jgi:WD40 repeat protein